MTIKTVLFDLDGTLVDTAPDLADALNFTLDKNGYQALSLDQIRPHVSNGSIALIEFGFNIKADNNNFERYRNELLDYYTENIANKSCLFPGFNTILDTIETRGLNWGIVTNKPSYLTNPLLKELKLNQRAVTVVSSDTLEFRKPHPAPMLYACKEAGSKPNECIFIGDAQRDVEAGNNAKIKTLVAMFGYIGENDRPETWGADGYIKNAREIIDYLDNSDI